MNSKTKKIVIAALMTSLACVSTMIIKIPSPLKGYLNLGDCVVLVAGWMLAPGYGFMAAGLGSALADVLSGYILYAPATFIIKGVMALIAFAGFKLMHKRLGKLPACLISGSLAEICMVLGYLVFEGFMYGFGPSLVNVLPNCVQGVAGVIIGSLLFKAFEKANITSR
jgi:uncharacterized membrane protein